MRHAAAEEGVVTYEEERKDDGSRASVEHMSQKTSKCEILMPVLGSDSFCCWGGFWAFRGIRVFITPHIHDSMSQ